MRLDAAVAKRIMSALVARAGVTVLTVPPTTAATGPAIVLIDPDGFYRRLASRPALAVGEGYMAGEWEPALGQDLAAVMEPFARSVAAGLPQPWRTLRRITLPRLPARLRNSLPGARRNISAHYDLSNDMFAAFLDPTMSYSAALFEGETPPAAQDLTAAQLRKVDRALDFAGVGAGTRLLEIGTGWGTLAIRAAQRGADVVTVTLSQEQADWARAAAARAGVADRIDIRLQDYREVTGRFDAIVSIEMIEAVGSEYWETYFATLDDRLAPGGRVAIQAITMPSDRQRAARSGEGWLQRYIFPGGEIPSLEAIDRICTTKTTLRVSDIHAFGLSYAETLRRWRASFLAAWPQIAALGFDDTFRRMWEYYLAYCQAGFAAGAIDVDQIVLKRPAAGPLAV